jgi:phage gp29-like protein
MLETLKPIMNLIQKGQSYQEVEDNLMAAWPNMKTAEIEKLMERAIFVSEIWGRLNP